MYTRWLELVITNHHLRSYLRQAFLTIKYNQVLRLSVIMLNGSG